MRTILDNGAVILVEPMPKEKTVSVQLWASSRYVPETEATHGYRHLLEHLIVTGPDHDLDRKLETAACFLKARTYRDATQMELTVGADQLPLAFETLRTILRKPSFTQEQIDNEVKVMREELALLDEPAKLSSAAWRAAYEESGLDPLGTFDSMYRATPGKLDEIVGKQFAADGLALVIAGPVDLDKATAMGRDLLGPRAKGSRKPVLPIREGHPGRVADAEGSGEARAALVPGFNSPQTVAALAAALAIASEFQNAFVTYTPTAQKGLVLVGRTESSTGLGAFIDSFKSPASLYNVGRQLAHEWIQRQLRTSSGVGYLRGLLLAQGVANRPEMLLEQLDTLTPAQFEAGMRALMKDNAVTAVASE